MISVLRGRTFWVSACRSRRPAVIAYGLVGLGCHDAGQAMCAWHGKLRRSGDWKADAEKSWPTRQLSLRRPGEREPLAFRGRDLCRRQIGSALNWSVMKCAGSRMPGKSANWLRQYRLPFFMPTLTGLRQPNIVPGMAGHR